MNNDFKVFVEKCRRKKEIKTELKKLDEEIEGMYEDLIEDMAEQGVENYKTARGETVYIHTRVAASPSVSREDAVGALRLAGHGDLISLNYNTTSVSSLLKELDEKDAIDPELEAAFKIHKIITVRVRGLQLDKE